MERGKKGHGKGRRWCWKMEPEEEEHTLVFLIGVEEEYALHKVLVEHPRMSDLEQMGQTELGKPTEVRVHQATDTVEEQGTPPLDVILLQEPSQESEGLLPDQQGLVLEAGRDRTDIRIHLGGVAYGQVTQDHDNVVTYCRVLGDEQLSCHVDNRFFGQVFILET